MPPEETINVQELFVTLGRLEGKVDALSGIDTRLRDVEGSNAVLASRVGSLEALRPQRGNWINVGGFIVALVVGLGGIIGTIFTGLQVAAALHAAH